MLACAFGRRSPVDVGVSEVDAIVVFDFGAGTHGQRTSSNEQLAAVALDLQPAPTFAQTEAAAFLRARGCSVIDIQELARSWFGFQPDAYVDTMQAALVAAECVLDAGWSTVAVVAHPAHAARCAAICEAHGLATAVPPQVERVDFDRRSSQWWTRRRSAWIVRELPVIAHHLVVGAFRSPRPIRG